MVQCIIEDLEKLLRETNELKHNLNSSCEAIWDLVCPPGSEHKGSFRVEKSTTVSSKNENENDSDNIPLQEDGAFSNVTDLIAYGKLIRNAEKIKNNKKGSEGCSSVYNRPGGNSQVAVHKTETNISKGKSTSKQLTIKQPINYVNSKNLKSKCGGKSQKTQTNLLFTFDEGKAGRVRNETGNKQRANKEPLTTDNKSHEIYTNDQKHTVNNETSSIPPLIKYNHSCSPTLTETVKSLKIPEDLRSLLRQYNDYWNIKLKDKQKAKDQPMHNFTERFNNLAKSRLERDLKENIKQGERYVKYLHVAEDVDNTLQETTLDGLHTRLHYKSVDELCIYEGKCQRVMELQLQRRLLNTISDILVSTSSDS